MVDEAGIVTPGKIAPAVAVGVGLAFADLVPAAAGMTVEEAVLFETSVVVLDLQGLAYSDLRFATSMMMVLQTAESGACVEEPDPQGLVLPALLLVEPMMWMLGVRSRAGLRGAI